MKFASLGQAYLAQARVWLETGGTALRGRNYAFAVLAAQECVEFSLRGALKKLGVEYPRTHDAGLVLLGNKDRLPGNMLSRLDWLVDVSRRLAMKRSQAAYGDEAAGVPAGRLFEKADAVTALRDANAVLALCSNTVARARVSIAPEVEEAVSRSGVVSNVMKTKHVKAVFSKKLKEKARA